MAPRDRPSWGRPRTLAVAAVLSAAALTAAASAAAQSPPGEPAQIGPTVYVGGVQDLRPGWGGAPSKCDRLVDAALGYGGAFSQAQFLVSTLWWDAGPLDPPPAWAGCQNYTLGTYYCFSRFNSTELSYFSYQLDPQTKTAVPVDEAQAAEFSGLLAACLRRAVDAGLDVAINVHLDDGRQQNGWRNTLAFDPLEDYGGFSYYDAVLSPIVDALNAALRDHSQAWLSLQGEMGATVFFEGWAWAEVADMVRGRLRPGPRVSLGLGINNSKLCGCVFPEIVDYDEYLAAFGPKWPEIEGWFDLEGIRAAFEAVDFVGISAYVAQQRLDFQPCDMERLMEKMDVEFAYYNLTLRELVDMGKDVLWIEWGVGGGASQNGDTPAATALEAAYYPFWGVQGPYDASRDPWQKPDVRDYMRHYVNTTSAYLLQGGCNYRVRAVYLWTVGGSWDVLGLWGTAAGWQGGTFRDEAAVDTIRRHNELARAQAAAAAGQPAPAPPAPAPAAAGQPAPAPPAPAPAPTDGGGRQA